MENSAELLGINTRVELAEVDKIFRERKVQELMLAGVTIEKPETVTIDACVRIGEDSIVEPFAQILGRTEIGEDCRIGACSIVENSHARVRCGNSAVYLRCGFAHRNRRASSDRSRACGQATASGQDARIGNFVELKNTRFGAGAKANHLAYLGDSDIGDHTNIGAGTITCNYDGVSKHKTQIGKDAFVGSNSTLVAPLEIGDGSYIGAGSVITHTGAARSPGAGPRPASEQRRLGREKEKEESELLLVL